jgi:hypothetical protein
LPPVRDQKSQQNIAGSFWQKYFGKLWYDAVIQSGWLAGSLKSEEVENFPSKVDEQLKILFKKRIGAIREFCQDIRKSSPLDLSRDEMYLGEIKILDNLKNLLILDAMARGDQDPQTNAAISAVFFERKDNNGYVLSGAEPTMLRQLANFLKLDPNTEYEQACYQRKYLNIPLNVKFNQTTDRERLAGTIESCLQTIEKKVNHRMGWPPSPEERSERSAINIRRS